MIVGILTRVQNADLYHLQLWFLILDNHYRGVVNKDPHLNKVPPPISGEFEDVNKVPPRISDFKILMRIRYPLKKPARVARRENFGDFKGVFKANREGVPP